MPCIVVKESWYVYEYTLVTAFLCFLIRINLIIRRRRRNYFNDVLSVSLSVWRWKIPYRGVGSILIQTPKQFCSLSSCFRLFLSALCRARLLPFSFREYRFLPFSFIWLEKMHDPRNFWLGKYVINRYKISFSHITPFLNTVPCYLLLRMAVPLFRRDYIFSNLEAILIKSLTCKNDQQQWILFEYIEKNIPIHYSRMFWWTYFLRYKLW